MSRRLLRRSILVIATMLVFAGSAGVAPAHDGTADFIARSQDLIRMHDLFQGGSGRPVTFASKTARAKGFSAESIALAEELTAYTNDLMAKASDTAKAEAVVDVRNLDVELRPYPRLVVYFAETTRYAEKSQAEEAMGFPGVPGVSEYVCGHFLRPRPPHGAPWRQHTRSNPAATLRSWGYHETPGFAGGGWTRPQTYNPALCGWNTYRDHAYIAGNNTIREQNYEGWTPRGEPNPEVWRSGPWPYPTWPAYVRWWHSRY